MFSAGVLFLFAIADMKIVQQLFSKAWLNMNCVHGWVCRHLCVSTHNVGYYTQTSPGRLLEQEGQECLESPEQ